MYIDVVFFIVGGLIVLLLIRDKLKKKPVATQSANRDNKAEEEKEWLQDPEPVQQNQESDSDVEGQNTEETRKRRLKEEKRQEKKERQEAQQQQWKQVNAKSQKYRQSQEEKERLEQQKRLEEEKYIQQIAEEDRKRKEEEYSKWKDSFVVESSGTDKKTAEQVATEKEQFDQNLLEYIKDNKICLLQDMSIWFKIPTKAVVDAIKALEEKKQVNGVFDERGKYIDVTEQEWNAIMSYMRAKGRVSKSDMMLQCANIIKQEGAKKNSKDLANLIDTFDGKDQNTPV